MVVRQPPVGGRSANTACAVFADSPDPLPISQANQNRLDHPDVLPNFRPLIQDPARVAELADALDSGSSAFTGVKVRVLSRAP